MIKLGDKAKDRITGYEGIVTGQARYLYRDHQVLIQPEKFKEGCVLEEEWFPVKQVIAIKQKK